MSGFCDVLKPRTTQTRVNATTFDIKKSMSTPDEGVSVLFWGMADHQKAQ
jgi:hypothetical protein